MKKIAKDISAGDNKVRHRKVVRNDNSSSFLNNFSYLLISPRPNTLSHLNLVVDCNHY